mmetsp:Transcript_34448/g.79534  ORF Transcript_34448/g.79534 Transcript_34448/m.79534 type:complete len:150 (+) Transcript_34448:511-960(+)
MGACVGKNVQCGFVLFAKGAGVTGADVIGANRLTDGSMDLGAGNPDCGANVLGETMEGATGALVSGATGAARVGSEGGNENPPRVSLAGDSEGAVTLFVAPSVGGDTGDDEPDKDPSTGASVPPNKLSTGAAVPKESLTGAVESVSFVG